MLWSYLKRFFLLIRLRLLPDNYRPNVIIKASCEQNNGQVFFADYYLRLWPDGFCLRLYSICFTSSTDSKVRSCHLGRLQKNNFVAREEKGILVLITVVSWTRQYDQVNKAAEYVDQNSQ